MSCLGLWNQFYNPLASLGSVACLGFNGFLGFRIFHCCRGDFRGYFWEIFSFFFSILWKNISSGLLCRAMGAYLLVSLPDLIFLFLFLEGRLLYMNLHTTNINYMVLSLYGSFCSAQCLITSLYLLFFLEMFGFWNGLLGFY